MAAACRSAAPPPVAPGAGGTSSPPIAGTTTLPPFAGSSAGASAPPAAGSGKAGGGDVPCPVAAVLELHCVECHGHKPRLGAPMSLTDAAAFSLVRSGMPVSALVSLRVQSVERPMPPSMLLAATDAAVLLQWVGAGAAPAAEGCSVKDPFDTGAAGGPAAGAGAAGTGVILPTAGAPATGPGTVGDGTGDWAMFGGTLSDTRDNPQETTLTKTNVAMLKELWTFKGAGTTSTPAIVDGVVYLPTWDGKVHALDAHTGKEIWATALPDLIDSSPAVTKTQIFVSDDNGSVHALERSKGTVQWSKSVDPHAEAHLWSSPIVIEQAGLIVVGVASGEEQVQPPYSFKGSVVGLDAATGAERWRFYTTTNDGSNGPGVGVWATAAVDVARKLVFIGTGNAYSGMAGQYTDSMLAINYETGQLAWARQFTTGDVFSIYGGSTGPDFDIGASANLFTVAGKDVLGIGIKSGDYQLLERDTGVPIWMAHISGGSSMGGIISTPAVADNKIFVASNTFGQPQGTTVAAIDAQRGSMLWMQKISGGLTYGGVIYANGVIFVGVSNGTINAFDATSGTPLWHAMAPDAIAGGPSIAHGMLFVPWGYTWTLREGMPGEGGLTAYGVK